jgi:hypothetical protein
LSDLQIPRRKLSETYKQLVLLAKIPEALMLNKEAKLAIQGIRKQPDHINTSTPISQPAVRRTGRQSLRPTTSTGIISPIRPLKRRLEADSEEEEETSRAEIERAVVRQPTLDLAPGDWVEDENDFDALDDRDFEDVVTLGDQALDSFHTPAAGVRSSVSRAFDDARALFSGETYALTFK